MEINDPSSFATYAIEVPNPEGRGAGISNQVHVSLVRTLPPPGDLQAHVAKQGVVLTWTGVSLQLVTPRVHYVYRVYRHAEGSTGTTAGGRSNGVRGADFPLPTEISNGKTYEYRVETVTVIDGQQG